MEIIRQNFIYLINRWLAQKGHISILFFTFATFFITASIYTGFDFFKRYISVKREVDYYSHWGENEAKLQNRLSDLKTRSRLSAENIYAYSEDYLYFEKMLDTASDFSLNIIEWNSGKEKQELNTTTLPLHLKMTGQTDNILKFIHSLENSGNPLVLKNSFFSRAEKSKLTEATIEIEVKFKNE